ncbi:MAG: hypothetical protein JKY31_14200 [Rhodobacteraceae bacterium]|nr:hypothetical protein [Paracoccaceae bacterium]
MEAIIKAWKELQSSKSSLLQLGSEAEVSALLEARLNQYCQSLPLWRDVVHSVQRGRESINHNGAKLEKRPDVSLVLLYGNRNFPMVVECKIIDQPNKKGTRLYCLEGISRFVCGDYAWASSQAMMLGYVRDGSTVSGKLSPYLTSKASIKPDPFQTLVPPQPRPDINPTVHHSQHKRSFEYLPSVNGTAPGPIDLYHLWLL